MPEPYDSAKPTRRMMERSIPIFLPEDRDPEVTVREFVTSMSRAARTLGIDIRFSVAVPGHQLKQTAAQSEPHAVGGGNAAASGQAPDPASAGSPEEFLACLRRLVDWAGLSTCRDLAGKAQQLGQRLSKSTAHRVLSLEHGRMPTLTMLESIVTACGIGGKQRDAWTASWRRCGQELQTLEAADTRHQEDGLTVVSKLLDLNTAAQHLGPLDRSHGYTPDDDWYFYEPGFGYVVPGGKPGEYMSVPPSSIWPRSNP